LEQTLRLIFRNAEGRQVTISISDPANHKVRPPRPARGWPCRGHHCLFLKEICCRMRKLEKPVAKPNKSNNVQMPCNR
jgi:hypothetical protein